MSVSGMNGDWTITDDVYEEDDIDNEEDKDALNFIRSMTGQEDVDNPNFEDKYQENLFANILSDPKFIGAIIRTHKRRTYRFKQRRPNRRIKR